MKPQAQEALYRMFSDALYGVCLRYASSASEAEDILHDGFIKIYQKINQYGFKGSFEGWMRRIVVNTALERFRNQYKVINLQDSVREKPELSYDNIIDKITADELLTIIQKLSPKYRMVFNLYAIEGYNHQEIAEQLGISEGTSKSNLSRARAILQDKVQQLYRNQKTVGIK